MIEGQARRSGVFLLELMISILFFCIAAAVGLQLFVKSHCISEDAGNMNMAVHKAAAAAEVFRSGTDMEDYLKEEYSYYEKEDNTFLVSFAADWENCKTKDAEYTLWITLGEAKQLGRKRKNPVRHKRYISRHFPSKKAERKFS